MTDIEDSVPELTKQHPPKKRKGRPPKADQALTSMGDEIDTVKKDVSEMKGSLSEILKSIKAMNNPVVIRKSTEAAAQELGSGGQAYFDESKENATLIDPSNINMDTAQGMDKIAMEAFMAEIVTVVATASSDKNSDPVVRAAVNGRWKYFPQDAEVQVPRCYVGVLAQAKPAHYGNKKITDQKGEFSYIYPRKVSLRYPFSVIGDSPKGVAWLKEILAAAA